MKNTITFLITTLAIMTSAQRVFAAPRAGGSANRDTSASRGERNADARSSFNNAPIIRPLSIQVLAGSQGFGAEVKYGYTPKLSFRAGFGVVPVNVNNLFGFSSFSANDQLSAKFDNIHLLADYSPFKTNRIRIVGGAAYIVRADATLILTPSGNYQFGNSTITKDQIGALNADVSWKGVAPYLGAAFFRSFPNRLFNMNLDVGTYYVASPSTSLTGTKMLSDNSSQEPQFNKNMQGYHWLPVIQLNFNFRIK